MVNSRVSSRLIGSARSRWRRSGGEARLSACHFARSFRLGRDRLFFGGRDHHPRKQTVGSLPGFLNLRCESLAEAGCQRLDERLADGRIVPFLDAIADMALAEL